MKKHITLLSILTILLSTSCSTKIPENFQSLNINPVVYPDYGNISIPWNIAPLNFNIKEEANEFVCVARSSKGESLLCTRKKVQWDIKKWKKLLEINKGDTLYIDIYVNKGNRWYKYPTVKNYITPEAIDSYISYRLIEPSYATYEYMTINQRNITNFDEDVIFSNIPLSENEDGQCINCHSFQNYNKTNRFQFHVRQYKGGTIFVTPKGIKKVNLKTDKTISAGVYPAWHPTMNIIAYSVNNTHQSFFAKNKDKIEVFDARSNLILYDVDKNEVRTITNDTTELATFPSWSPDGKYLYYVSATYPDSIASKNKIVLKYKDVHYNIYRRSFDLYTQKFGSAELVFNASAINKSATFPRISPDNKYLLFTLADYGTFHIWHKSSDLQLIDLKTGALCETKEINSTNVESYHSWSSNGSWIIFSSRRDDGSYTRPYISYFKNGKPNKPFILPQKDPDFYKALFKSFNIPEFMAEPVTVTQRELMKAVNKEATTVTFSPK
jgi:dipeptidyl aminopeptidase/acylaminoacyl peptidase